MINEKIVDLISDELYVEIDEFPIQTSEEITAAQRINLYPHTTIRPRKTDLFG